MRSLLLLAALSVVFGVGCMAHEPDSGACKRVADRGDEGALKTVYADHRQPLLVLDSGVFVCGCGGRAFGEAAEARKHGADEEERRHGADEEGRRFGSDEEDRRRGDAAEDRRHGAAAEDRDHDTAAEGRRHGAAAEDRDHGDADENRRTGSASEQRSYGDALSSLQCVAEPKCPPYFVSGAGAAQIYDGEQLRSIDANCLRRPGTPTD